MMTATKVFLSSEQIDKLRRVLNPIIPIYPSPSSSTFPTLHIVPQDFLRHVLLKLNEQGIVISGVRLNGGAASYVLINDSNFAYRDIDILFCIETPLSSQRETTLFSSTNEPCLCEVWTIIKYIICSCLIEYMPDRHPSTQKFFSSVLDTYTKKNIQITSEHDSWALLSLQNLLGRNLELKFIEHWKRQWQFSVDSFQIDLRELLSSSHSQTITRKVSGSDLQIGAFNAVNIRKSQTSPDTSSTPLQFGFFTPSSSPSPVVNQAQLNLKGIHCQTLTTITTIDASNTPTMKCPSRSTKASTDIDDLENAALQFQISLNEDIDDGIVVDTDGSTVEDDDPVFRTPPMEVEHVSRSEHTYPPRPLLVEVFCAYKDLHEALYHLNKKLIATYEPEKLRGGGLLKYCDLLAQNYKPFDQASMVNMQRYMCSRFFIDFKTLPEQMSMITKYVATHFLPCSLVNELYESNHLYEIFQHLQQQQNQAKEIDQTELINARLCLLFFEHLFAVIYQSCVCLSVEDRDLLLATLRCLKDCYHAEYEYLFVGDMEHCRKYHTFQPQYSQTGHNAHRFSTGVKNYNSYRSNNQRYVQSARQAQHGQRYHANQTVYPSNHRRYQ